MWDFDHDMRRWDEIAREAHARHCRDSNSAYVQAQSIVEARAHRYVAALAASHRRVVELGVGGGEHLAFAPHLDRHDVYMGVDISPAFADICRARFGIPVTVADLAALPFDDASYDCAIAISLLEHVEQLEQGLKEVARVLAPGGRFYAVIPTNGSIAVNLFKMTMTYPTMRRRGIRRPDLVWHYLNVNTFKRVRALLHSQFHVTRERALPLPGLPWQLSPLWGFECLRR